MPDEKAPSVYGNIVQVTRTPWEVNLHILHVVTPRDQAAGTKVDALKVATEVVVVTLPLETGKSLIEVLQKVTAADVPVEPVKERQDA